MEHKKIIKCYFSSNFIKKNKTAYLKIVVIDLQNVIFKIRIKFKKKNRGLANDACINKVFRKLNKLELNNTLNCNYKVNIFTNNKILVNQVLNNGIERVKRQRRGRIDYLTSVLNSHKNWGLQHEPETNNILNRLYSNGLSKKKDLLKKKRKQAKIISARHRRKVVNRKICKIINNKTANIVFFDLEMNCGYKTKKDLGYMETISIGAIKYNIKNGTLEQFYSLVKPKFNCILSKECIRLTQLEQNEIDNANDFKTVMLQFGKWVNNEKSIFVSWGAEDIRTLKNEDKVNGFRLQIVKQIRKRYIDFQNEFCLNFLKTGQVISLTNALKSMKLDFLGTQHNAFDDAFNLYRVYKCYKNEVLKNEKLE